MDNGYSIKFLRIQKNIFLIRQLRGGGRGKEGALQPYVGK